MPPTTVRVLIVDDHPAVRRAVAAALSHFDGIEVVGAAEDGEQAVSLTEELQPDVVLMDVNMPRLNGIRATKQIVESWPNSRVIGLSMCEEMAVAEKLLNAGAVEFLMKGVGLDALVAAIRR